MKDLCHDVFGVLKEKKDPKEVKGNRGNNSYVLLIFMLGICFFITPLMSFLLNCSDVFATCIELLDAFPEKRAYEDGGYISDEEKEVHFNLFMYI